MNNKQILINKISLVVGALFLITSLFLKNIWLILIGVIMVGASAYKINYLKKGK